MNKYYVFGLVLIVTIILYGLFKLYLYSTNSFDDSESRTLFRDKVIEGSSYMKSDLYDFQLKNKFTVGFVLAPTSPEYKFNEIKHIFSITKRNFTMPDNISPGTEINRSNMEKIIKDNVYSLNDKQQSCKNLLTIRDDTNADNILLSTYITEDSKSIAVNVNTNNGYETLYNYDLRYGEPQVVIIEVDSNILNIYINGKLTNSKDMMSAVNFNIFNDQFSVINGMCNGYSGYLHYITTWSSTISQKDKEAFSKYALGSYNDITKNDTNNSYPMVKCSI